MCTCRNWHHKFAPVENYITTEDRSGFSQMWALWVSCENDPGPTGVGLGAVQKQLPCWGGTMHNLDGCWSTQVLEPDIGQGNARRCSGWAQPPAAASDPLEELFSSLAGEAVRCVSCDRQLYDNINTWLRGSGGLRALVEEEGCAPAFGKVLCPTCQEPAGVYLLLVES